MTTNFIIHKLFPFYHTYNGGNTMDLYEIKKEIGYSKDYIVREITIDKKKNNYFIQRGVNIFNRL